MKGVMCLVFVLSLVSLQPPAAMGQGMPMDRAIRQVETMDPSVKEVIAAAEAFHALDASQIDGHATAASWKYLLPRLSAGFRQNTLATDVDKFDYIAAGQDQAGLDQIGGTTQELRVGATWDLPGLAYNGEVLDTYVLRDQRQALVKEVVRLYYLRKRLKIAHLVSPPADPRSRLSSELKIEELTATLDALTGGKLDWSK